MEIFEKIVTLADASTKKFKASNMKWMWGEALFNYALSKLDDVLNEDRFLPFYKAYMDSHLNKGYVVDQSDTSAPGLVAYSLYKKLGKEKYLNVVNDVINYIKNSPKIIEDMPNHLGTSNIGKFYPKSIWVDSIMMYGVFTNWVGSELKDLELMNYAIKQPLKFKTFLQDENTKLFYHSYWVKRKKPYPKRLFWARGNGWVVTALPIILDFYQNENNIETKDNILSLFKELSESLLKYQCEDGYFETLLNRKSYKEASATALIACGFLHGVRCGYLDERFKIRGIKALNAVINDLKMKDGLLSMPYISGPTIPLQVFPYLGYKLIPRQSDWPYGLAAIILAGIEYKKLMEESHE